MRLGQDYEARFRELGDIYYWGRRYVKHHLLQGLLLIGIGARTA